MPSKACRVRALNLGGYRIRSHSAGYGPVSYTHLTLPTIYSV